MRFKITLTLLNNNRGIIPLNYQYPLSSVIYKILERADPVYSEFLHEEGYGQGLKRFKLFTFSDINTPFRIKGDRLCMSGDHANFIVCFHLPQAAENFIKGLFLQQQIDIADQKSKATFIINQIEALPVLPAEINATGIYELKLEPISPLVCGKKNEKGNYDFLSPEHPEFTAQLMYNWKEKYIALHGTEQAELAFSGSGIDVVLGNQPPKSRLLSIKAGTNEETRIRGFMNFSLKIRGRKDAFELLLNAGLGVYNSLGMGMMSSEARNG